jgi:hypothetical protein
MVKRVLAIAVVAESARKTKAVAKGAGIFPPDSGDLAQNGAAWALAQAGMAPGWGFTSPGGAGMKGDAV